MTEEVRNKEKATNKELIELANKLMTMLNVDTTSDAMDALHTIMAALPVSSITITYRTNLPEQFNISLSGVPKNAAALLILNRVLGFVQNDIAIQALKIQQEEQAKDTSDQQP